MPHVYALEAAQLSRPAVIAIGVFDGVHRGHEALVLRLVREAHASNREAVVLTFFPHPDAVLHGQAGRYYLTSPEERAQLLLNLGVDWVITHPFDDDVRQMRAQVFVERLLRYARMAALWVGADFALGYQREGDVAFLRARGAVHGFAVETVELVGYEANGGIITSTSIREALRAGDMQRVRERLGRSYSVTGTVIDGYKRGRTIGFPTANIAVWPEQALPANGVYAGWATLGTETWMAVTNIGVRPTFDGHSITVETFLLDFDRNIYGQTMTVTFETRLRPEMKFAGIDALIAQITADAAAARMYLLGER